MRNLIFCLVALSAMAVSAMPTKKEVNAARDVVAELMSDVVADQKAGKLTSAQVAEKALGLAARAETAVSGRFGSEGLRYVRKDGKIRLRRHNNEQKRVP